MRRKRPAPEHQANRSPASDVTPSVPAREKPSPLSQHLQNLGNPVTGRWLQAKLKVGAASDAAEQEADRIAEQVTQPARQEHGGQGQTGQQPIERNASENQVRAKPAATADASATPSHAPSMAGLLSGGEPFSPELRGYFEPRMGASFDAVRVHRGPEAAEAAHSLQAQAYTTGEDIVFGEGKYAPETEGGKKLLAHELTHVVQQRRQGADAVIQRQPSPPGPSPVPPHLQLELHPLGESLHQRHQLTLGLPQLGFHLLPGDRMRISDFLDEHLTLGPDQRLVLNGLTASFSVVVDAAMSLLLPVVPRSEVEDFVLTYWQRRITWATMHPPAQPGSSATPPPQLVPSFTLGSGLTAASGARPNYSPSLQFPVPGGPPFRLPQLGESLQRPHLQPTFPLPRLGFHLLPSDRAMIRAFLAEHLTVGPGLRPTLNGFETTIPGVVDAVMPLLLPVVPRSEAEEAVQTYWAEQVAQALLRAPTELPPVPISAPTPTFTAGVNFAAHVNLTPGPTPPCALNRSMTSCDATLQLQIGEDAPLQRIFQISYNFNSGQVQVVAGGQATADLDIIKDLLKLSGFVQILAGVAWTGNPASGTFAVVQPSAGAQLTLTWRSVQFAVQAGPSVTAVQGQPVTGDINATAQITVPFGSSPRREHRTASTELTGVFEVRDWVERARFSELERLPTDEKTRLISILLGGGTVIGFDVEAVIRIWDSIDSGMERQKVRQFIASRLSQITNQALQDRLRAVIAEKH